ncbi:hypothetical protein ACG2F4_12560 [Halalkalibaculum sp. DA3122]|uniref:hypothetical protein n=1 Tax=Halalkalibaculum sp. DA384 TaxID=3373606 RepID=UPI00375534EB
MLHISSFGPLRQKTLMVFEMVLSTVLISFSENCTLRTSKSSGMTIILNSNF